MLNQKFTSYTGKSTLQLLKQLSFAEAFNPVQAETFANHLKAYQLKAGEFLLEENHENNSLYFLCEGQLEVLKQGPTGSNKVLEVLGKGKVVGEASFFDHILCSATVVAKEPVIVLALDRGSFIQLSVDSPHCTLAMTLELFRMLTRRLRDTSTQLINLV